MGIQQNDVKGRIGLGAGTHIATIIGAVPLGRLCPGDRVLTRDRGYHPVAGLRTAPLARAASVTIPAGAFGDGLPERDLVLAPGQGILWRDAALVPQNGTAEALVPALARTPGIATPGSHALITLHLATTELILAEGIWVECLADAGSAALAPPRPRLDRAAPWRHEDPRAA